MKSHTEYLTINLPQRMAFKNITSEVNVALMNSGIREGLLLCNKKRRSVQASRPLER